ncbi:PLP-dependent transferase [Microthyrium microscopicum]|uniref:Molybdenum cofactor sulfurase n=1 Tax=Microthyrium microscopicum TaxID=703497 RepID=A0A6A6UGR2_9PEZI|nr:PLP-dependent transferase [Microthyrium microscopicum]
MDPNHKAWYNQAIEQLRGEEFPMLQGTIYLDHAGTAIPSKSLMSRFATDMTLNLYGNPHSTSLAAQATSKKIERIRLQLLQYFSADPDHFDLVFVANATAGIKLVAEAFREAEDGFWFGYHHAAHTSVVGVREVAKSQQCFKSDEEVKTWISSTSISTSETKLFAYPAQSNMNGTRLPLTWCGQIRQHGAKVYSLLDAAALASTTPLDLSCMNTSPDFTVVSLYKIFGFPDLGALIIRKDAGHIFQNRKYFGGGTVDMVTCTDDRWFARRMDTLHEQLEDGSLPIHNILAIEPAMNTYNELFGSLDQVSRHCAFLAQRLYKGLSDLQHSNRRPACYMYVDGSRDFADLRRQGPVLAFNICDSRGSWIGTTEVEKLASIKNIQLRTGGLCNPGGVAAALNLSANDMKENYRDGQRCGNDHDIMRGQPTSMIRVSLGPINTIADVDSFISFVEEFFVESDGSSVSSEEMDSSPAEGLVAPFTVESLMVFPVKSCSGWKIPAGKRWRVYNEGLAWDREWCVILAGSGAVMSQKRYPRMALIRPQIDLDEGLLRLSFTDQSANIAPIVVPLYLDPASPMMLGDTCREATVCGDNISARAYTNPDINSFFTQALGVSCHLGRFPSGGSSASSRHAKDHLQPSRQQSRKRKSGGPVGDHNESKKIPILLSNESPILTISSSSLNRLNEQIKSSGGKAVRAEAFRANIVVGEAKTPRLGPEQPYAEDNWRMVRIADQYFEFLGPCRRCQMVCIDQDTGLRNQEPFTTLAKTRRFDGKIFFGQHCSHVPSPASTHLSGSKGHAIATIATGDPVYPIL